MTTTFEPIQQAASKREHGTRARYVGGRCRCLQCRAANSRYSTERDHARRIGDYRELVDAKPARLHLSKLSRIGIGYKTVAEGAKVSINVIAKIRSGERKQIRRDTETRILAVTKQNAPLGDRSLVDSEPTWKLLDKLLTRGYSKTQLAAWLGMKAPSLQIKRGGKITLRTAFNVSQLFQKIEDGHLRRA